MNKQEFAASLSEKMKIPQSEALRFIHAMQEIISEELDRDGVLLLQGFGTFSPWKQVARAGRNPKTGVPCVIPPRTSVKFKPGKHLLDKLNGIG
ncbi:MAG: HU family DNA-binding protein [Parabacteroides sp.]|nr:HU family DNA-binding protein [Parabacteroides sp.]